MFETVYDALVDIAANATYAFPSRNVIHYKEIVGGILATQTEIPATGPATGPIVKVIFQKKVEPYPDFIAEDEIALRHKEVADISIKVTLPHFKVILKNLIAFRITVRVKLDMKD